MRTTLTIEDDVAAELERERRRNGEPFESTVNRVLRAGLATLATRTAERSSAYRTKPVSLGESRLPNLDDVSDVLEHGEGPLHR